MRPVEIAPGMHAIGVDIETSGDSKTKEQLSIGRAGARLLIFSDGDSVITFDTWEPTQYDQAMKLMEALKDKGVFLVGHNLVAFDAPILIRNGFPVNPALLLDTLILERIHLQGYPASAGLDATLKRHFKVPLKKKFSRHSAWNQSVDDLASDIEAMEYAKADALYLIPLLKEQLANILKKGLTEPLILETSLSDILVRTSIRGMDVDLYSLEKVEADHKIDADAAKAYLDNLLGIDFQIGKSDHVGKALVYTGVAPTYTPKTGKVKTDAKTLGRAVVQLVKEDNHEGAKIMRHVRTLKTYAAIVKYRKIIERHIDKHGKVHGGFTSYGAETSRMSSSNLNFQSLHKSFREVFQAPHGFKYVIGDYSQVEVRLAALQAGDEALIKACMSDDLYSEIGSEIYGIDASEVAADGDGKRLYIKSVVLGSQYGGGVDTLIENGFKYEQDIDRASLQFVMDGMRQKYPRWAMHQERVKHFANSAQKDAVVKIGNGYVRIVPRPVYQFEGRFGGQPAVRYGKVPFTQVLNAPTQGIAAVLMKKAMLRVSETWLKDYVVNCVHDEVVVVAPEELAQEAASLLNDCMAQAGNDIDIDKTNMPCSIEEFLAVDVNIANYWKK